MGIFNGVGDGQKNTSNTAFQDDRELDARLIVQPFKATSIAALQNLGFGVAGSWGDASITNTLGLPNTTGGAHVAGLLHGRAAAVLCLQSGRRRGHGQRHPRASFAPGVLLLRPVWIAWANM